MTPEGVVSRKGLSLGLARGFRECTLPSVSTLAGKVLFVSGASRGIGLAIALRAARDGAKIVVVAKTGEPDPRLPGTIYSAASAIEAAGGEALPVVTDIRDPAQVDMAVKAAEDAFGGIDILVNNASAISLSKTEDTPIKRFDLMHQVNARGTFLCTQRCLPLLRKAANPHVLNLCPPLNLDAKWFKNHVAYTMAKYGMSMCVLGMAAEFGPEGIAVNGLWPRTAIATAAVANLLGGDEMLRRCRKPEIVADAAHAIFVRDAKHCTGNFFLDDEVLRSEGVTDLSHYAVDPTCTELAPDFFLD